MRIFDSNEQNEVSMKRSVQIHTLHLSLSVPKLLWRETKLSVKSDPFLGWQGMTDKKRERNLDLRGVKSCLLASDISMGILKNLFANRSVTCFILFLLFCCCLCCLLRDEPSHMHNTWKYFLDFLLISSYRTDTAGIQTDFLAENGTGKMRTLNTIFRKKKKIK